MKMTKLMSTMVMAVAMKTTIRLTEGGFGGGGGGGGKGCNPRVLSFLHYGDNINHIRSQFSSTNNIKVTFPER